MLCKSITSCGLALGLLMLCPAPGSAQELRLSIDAGRVTLQARNVSVRQIMAEWERVGQTSVPNRERIPDGMVTLTLTDVPESSALSTLLRSGNGYLAVARPSPVASASAYRTILLMAAAPKLAAVQPPPASRGDGALQNPNRRLMQQMLGGGQGDPQGGGIGPRPGSPFNTPDRDGPEAQDPNLVDPSGVNPGMFQMRTGPGGPVVTMPFRDPNAARADPSDMPTTTAPAGTPPAMVPTSPAGATRPGEVVPGPPKGPGSPMVPSRPPG